MVEWQHGGATALDNLVMLCCQHHDQIHSTEWRIDMSSGKPKFIPPPWMTDLWTQA
ncbi:HNH endonuclease signature motif containing protein [Pseudonocardia sp. CA-107938]|uniref:HNH endonuclease signature motif containing protein n=1 Tax=Pseudonocardia sp. CA-107938 TaxID=3240021 RepID=UPI003D8F7255